MDIDNINAIRSRMGMDPLIQIDPELENESELSAILENIEDSEDHISMMDLSDYTLIDYHISDLLNYEYKYIIHFDELYIYLYDDYLNEKLSIYFNKEGELAHD